MDIRSRQDVNEFVQAINNSHSSVLSSATSGYHYHLIEASSQERLDLIGEQLEKAGFLRHSSPGEVEKPGIVDRHLQRNSDIRLTRNKFPDLIVKSNK